MHDCVFSAQWVRQIRRSVTQNLSYQACLDMELRCGVNFMLGDDFFNGVKAVLIDKAATPPSWSPPTLEAVSDDAVAAFFDPPPSPRL